VILKQTSFKISMNTRGVICKLFSVFFFVLMASAIKITSRTVPFGEAVFFRSLFALPVIFCWLLFSSNLRSGLKIVSFMGHFWRGVVGTTAMAFMFLGLALLPLPEVTAISYSAPILTVVFAIFILKENVRLFRLSAVLVGFLGVLIVVGPRLTVLSSNKVLALQDLGAFFVVLGAIFMALAHIFIRQLTRTETAYSIVFYFTTSSCVFALTTIPFGWVAPSQHTLTLLILSGVLGGFGQIFLTQAYKYSEASAVAPFEYVSIIFASLLSYFIFNELITLQVVVGSGVIIFAGIIIIWRERKLGINRSGLKESA
tara:strand:+ start:265 stop:1206 length:942 start_codon:yes stop_codon:yes gene_type:complete